jgi:hypothetical protein
MQAIRITFSAIFRRYIGRTRIYSLHRFFFIAIAILKYS